MGIQQSSLALFLDPGLGKTTIALAIFKILKSKGLIDRMLVVAPLQVMYSAWPGEIDKWAEFADFTWTFLHGPHKEAVLDHTVHQADIAFINPEGCLWLFDPKWERYKKLPPRTMLVIDESTRFKSYSSKRFKLLQKALHIFPRRYIMSGTPTPQGAQDFFPQAYILDRGAALGRFITHFRREFMVLENPYDPHSWTLADGAFDRIMQKMAPLSLSLTAEDHLDMPDLMVIPRKVRVPEKVMKDYYWPMFEHYIMPAQKGGEMVVAENTAVRDGKLRQICNGFVYYEEDYDDEKNKTIHCDDLHDVKLKELESLLEELAGAPVIICYEFQRDFDRIRAKFGKWEEGGLCAWFTSNRARNAELVRLFNLGKIPVLLGHPASMGHGLNLQEACHHQIWYGLQWNFEYYDQAFRRIYRQGQKSPHVFIYHIVTEGTVEDHVSQVLIEKDATQQKIDRALQTIRRDQLSTV